MDYVEGAEAGQFGESPVPYGMPAHDVCAIVTAVAAALDDSHQWGLLHRDIKPANILLTEPQDGERWVPLADFGIARQLADISGLTATNMAVGKVAYAAPEQLTGEELDWRAGQYAVGRRRVSTSRRGATVSAFRSSGRHWPTPQCHTASACRNSARTRCPDSILAIALAKNPDDRSPRCTNFAHALALTQVRAITGSRPLGQATTPPAARAKPATATPPPS